MKWKTALILPCVAVIFVTFTPSAFSQARKPIRSLADIEVFTAVQGMWEGVGTGFDINNGELDTPQTFRDDWEGEFKPGNLAFEMTGLVKHSGKELPYSWTFKFNGDRDKITAKYEMATDRTGVLGVKVIADGKRLQLHPIQGQKGIDMTIDIYFEDDDIVIESQVRDLDGKLVYQSATRYQKIEKK